MSTVHGAKLNGKLRSVLYQQTEVPWKKVVIDRAMMI
jgi:hypothetical protein